MSLYDHETWFMMTTLMHQARKVWTLSCVAECDRIPKQRLFLFPICDVIVRKFTIPHSCTINTFCTCVPVKTCLIPIQRPTSHSVEAPGVGGPLLYASDDHECLGSVRHPQGLNGKEFSQIISWKLILFIKPESGILTQEYVNQYFWKDPTF
jgi:hypothetical protein